MTADCRSTIIDASHAALVFLRAPEEGRVKTRLAKHLGNRLALSLYRRFVADTLHTLGRAGLPIRICFHPPDKEEVVKNWLGEAYEYWPQSGQSLGEKMANAFSRAFDSGLDRVVLLGTDIPDLPGRIMRQSMELLETHPAVIGPASDGGYYLIGFHRHGFLPAIFDGMPWGTGDVLPRTLAVFQSCRVPVHRLPVWQDVDDDEDLKAFIRRNRGRKTPAKQTMAFIKRLCPAPAGMATREENHGDLLQSRGSV